MVINTELTFLEDWFLIAYYALQTGCERSTMYTINPVNGAQSAPVHQGKANILLQVSSRKLQRISEL